MHLWAAGLLLCFGVPQPEVAGAVLEVFARVAVEWPRVAAAPALFARTARRRWIAGLLLERAADRRSTECPPPRDVADLDASVSPPAPATPEQLVTARELLQWLPQHTTPTRWRVWLAREVDDMPVAEIARQEGCSLDRIRDLLERARGDLQAALSREAASARGSFAPRARRRSA